MAIVRITATPNGEVEIHVTSILFDLWCDYEFFRKEAENMDPSCDSLRYKRLVRASINAFYSYFDGCLNMWISQIDPSYNLESGTIGAKIGVVRREISQGRGLPWLDLKSSRALRNKICHLKLTDNDLEIVDELLSGRFFSDADHIISWLRVASHRLGIECHPNVPKILHEYADALGKQTPDTGNG